MLIAPADWPPSTILAGSPPKAAMLSRSHSSASRWSRRPTFFSGTAGELANPKKFIRKLRPLLGVFVRRTIVGTYFIVTTIMSEWAAARYRPLYTIAYVRKRSELMLLEKAHSVPTTILP